MNYRAIVFLLLILSLSGFFTPSVASVESDIIRTLKIEETPLDLAVSVDGRWIFVLTEQGNIFIYTADGTLSDSIAVDKDVDGIKVGPRENTLLLTNRKDKTVQLLALEFIQAINISGSPFKGPANAPVVMVVFDDFQCPYCAKLAPILDRVFEMYPDEMKLVFKNFPLSKIHPFATEAAIAALAANRQGKFWEFHDELYRNYNRLSSEKIRQTATDLGLDMAKFDQALKDPQIQARVSSDFQEGIKAGIRGTPTVFINGRQLRTNSIREMRSVIEKELGKASK
jgi:protein-disulfide isomerase